MQGSYKSKREKRVRDKNSGWIGSYENREYRKIHCRRGRRNVALEEQRLIREEENG